MLTVFLTLVIFSWAFWLAYMIRYPAGWNKIVDSVHSRLAPVGLSASWMRKAEKGMALKVIVGSTTVLAMVFLAIVLRHPDALAAYLKHHE